MARLNRADEPPRDPRRLWLRRVKIKDRRLTCIVIGSCTWGYNLHWAGERSEPCWKPKKTCPGCRRHLPQKWRAYLHVDVLEAKRQEFLELTPEAWEDLMRALKLGEPLRGTVFTVERTGHDKGPLRLELRDRYKGSAKIPAEKNPERTLAYMWGITLPAEEDWDDPGLLFADVMEKQPPAS